MEQLETKAAILLMQILEADRRMTQAEELSRLFACIENLEQQYRSIQQEMQDLKQQIAAQRESPVKREIAKAVQFAENQLEQVGRLLHTVRENITLCVQHAVDNCKKFGVAALDKALSLTGVRQLLEAIQSKLSDSIESIQTSIERTEVLGQELRSVGKHLKNAGRTAVGKEIQQRDVTEEGRFQTAVLAPMRTTKKLLTGMRRSTTAAIRSVDRLHHTAEINREKRSSVRQRLEEKKGEMSTRVLPALPKHTSHRTEKEL